ncbi:isopentenyl-diphosphate Delta-isomerase [Nitratireductor thuwali]|uniref:Isopentenyl-diphosphate Delta-isomerase n=1 Tax=Nitratireductor thuwali TaxID=2267699 RepID=A0ABY5MH28_9HYPH|nr:Isopentenyl-diphosphate Delta-isomerase [Nitratireductor thuwali]
MPIPAENVVLVDPEGQPTGIAGKLEAHRRGLRHRAVSVFLLNGAGEMLIQQRAAGKYHSPGRWANACCTHPRPGEEPAAAAARRLGEELGIRSPPIFPFGTVAYRETVSPTLIEDEVCQLFTGRFDAAVRPNPAEVAATRWVGKEALLMEVESTPERFAVWFRIYLERHAPALFSAGG